MVNKPRKDIYTPKECRTSGLVEAELRRVGGTRKKRTEPVTTFSRLPGAEAKGRTEWWRSFAVSLPGRRRHACHCALERFQRGLAEEGRP